MLYKLNLLKFLTPQIDATEPINFKGLTFTNKLGIAAGLDKNGDYIDALGSIGFGFIEVGTVTPLPQAGNSKPRIFRLQSQQGIINRLGFNNKGVDYLVRNLKKRSFPGVLGVNIGANKNSKSAQRVDDYVHCFTRVAPYADYITVNISSPNTPNLRDLHTKDHLEALFTSIANAREALNFQGPIFIKLSPDETNAVIQEVVFSINRFKFDGVIASNTTLDRGEISDIKISQQSGGLSGRPLFNKSNDLISQVRTVDSNLFQIGVGGVFNNEDFNKKIDLGASLVQIYTSFVYEGPSVLKTILNTP